MNDKQSAIKILREEVLGTDFDVSSLVNKVIDVTSEYTVINDLSIKTLIDKYDTGTQRSIDTLVNEKVSKTAYSIEKDRAARYLEYEKLISKIPAVEQAIEILSTNISTPELTLTSPVLINKPLELPSGTSNEHISIMQERLRLIIKKFNIDEIITKMSWDLPVYGDTFCEIENYGKFVRQQGFMESKDSNEKILEFSEVLIKTDGDEFEIVDVLEEVNQYKNYTTDFLLSESVIGPKDGDDDEVPLNHIRVNVLNPKKVIVVHKYNEILGYIVIEVEKGKEGFNMASGDETSQKIDQLATKILEGLFRNKERVLKKILDENPEFVAFVGSLLKAYKKINSVKARFVHISNMIYVNNPSSKYEPYGKSALDSITEWGKYVIVGMRSTMLYRFTRAPDLRIFKVDIGADRDAMNYIQKVKAKIQQRKYALDPNADIDVLSSQITMFDDLWVPTRNGQEFFTIDNITQGDLNTKLDDLKYLNDQMINNLASIPPSYLSSDRSADDRLLLAQQNARFAKTVIKYQSKLSKGIDELVKKIYILAYGSDPLLSKFEIKLFPPVSLFVEKMSESFNNIQSIVSTLRDLKIPDEYIFDFLSVFFDNEKLEKYRISEKLKKIENASQKGEENEESENMGF